MLNRLDVSSDFINVCKYIYSDSKFRVKMSNSFSNFIPKNIGVKQGCSLSLWLFNLIIKVLLIGLDNMDVGYTFNNCLHLNYLAYANDLCIIDKTEDEIQHMIGKIEKICD